MSITNAMKHESHHAWLDDDCDINGLQSTYNTKKSRDKKHYNKSAILSVDVNLELLCKDLIKMQIDFNNIQGFIHSNGYKIKWNKNYEIFVTYTNNDEMLSYGAMTYREFNSEKVCYYEGEIVE